MTLPPNSVYQCTGIQALDLLGRKILLGSKGKCVHNVTLTTLKFARPTCWSVPR